MHLILLHGAVSSKEQFNFLLPALQESYTVHALNFPGHGGGELPEVFSIELFAQQVLEYIGENIVEEEGKNGIDILGYSMGGYVGMYLGRHHGKRFGKIITLATKFNWDEEVAAREMKMLNPETIEDKIPAFAGKLAEVHHPADWKIVLNKTADMLGQMGASNPLQLYDYNAIQNECLLLLGDHDKMVSLAETAAVYNQLPRGQLGVLPATGHPLESVDASMLSFFIRRFLG